MMDFKVYNEVKNRKLGYNFLEKKKKYLVSGKFHGCTGDQLTLLHGENNPWKINLIKA